MEPIGQKVLTNTSEEILVSSEIDENSVENITKQIFDETLENVLLETNVGKDFLSSQMENSIKLDSSNPIDLTKKILNSGETFLETDIQQVPDSDIAMEVMEEILLTNEGSEEVNEKLQNFDRFLTISTNICRFRQKSV